MCKNGEFKAGSDSFPLSDKVEFRQALIGLGAERSASSSLALTAHSFQYASSSSSVRSLE